MSYHVDKLISGLSRNLGVRRITAINSGESGSSLLRLIGADNRRWVLKVTEPGKIPHYLREKFPSIIYSEYLFYTQLQPYLDVDVPKVYSAKPLQGGGNYLLLEDLAAHNHLVEDLNDSFNEVSYRQIILAYAKLHISGFRYLKQNPTPNWLQEDPRRLFRRAQVLDCVEEFAENPWTRAVVGSLASCDKLPRLLATIDSTLVNAPTTILYNDFNPLNIVLPGRHKPAVLFDWQLVGRGPWHVDLCDLGILDGKISPNAQIRLLRLYLAELAHHLGWKQDVQAFRRECKMAALLRWAVFMPTMVKAMHRCNRLDKGFSPWMEQQFSMCIKDFKQALAALD